jgi:hypothetical protein
MDPIILDRIPFPLRFETLLERVCLKQDRKEVTDLRPMADEAQRIGMPKALYRISYIEAKDEERVVIDGTTLTSRVLRVNLDNAHRVFPFVATCGTELDAWANAIGDMLRRYWAEMIKEMALRCAINALHEHLIEHFRPGKTSRMNPGSLKDWPIEEQRALFAILGNTEDTIGVHLTESLLMIPTRSVSGIFFPTEVSFESCQLCPREKCPGRRAPYDSGLYDRRYQKRTALSGQSDYS